MNITDINQEAKKAAEKSLSRGFDWQAFLVYSVAIMNEERTGDPVDYVPEIGTDENIQELLTLFVNYVNEKKSYNAKMGKASDVSEMLDAFLLQMTRILKEIRLSCDTKEEKEAYLKHIESIKKLG